MHGVRGLPVLWHKLPVINAGRAVQLYFEQCDVQGLTYDRLLPFFFIDFVFASKWPACSFASQTNSA